MSIGPFLVVTALLALALTPGCDKKEDTKIATQVAAKVNGEEITVHQINYALASTRGVTPETAPKVKQQILDRLIDQQLAKRQAVLRALDRSPSVMQAIEAAKSEILVRAYRDSLVENLSKPKSHDIKTYYREHPELFAQRRLFNLEELAFAATSDVATGLRDQLSKARPLTEIADWLRSQGVKFAANRGVRAAEQIPLEVLPKLQAMKEGEILLFDAGDGGFQVIRMVTFKAAPVGEATATPRIQQFLSNRTANEVIAKDMELLRKNAKIEYVGEFAGGTAGTKAKAAAETEAQPKSEESSKERSQK